MRVLVIGSGAREHALAWKIRQSPELKELFAAPGNPGIAALAQCLPIPADNLPALVQAARDHAIDLIVVGPEDPLAAGLVDDLQAAGILAFGPTASAARLESSKRFAKELMLRHGIPTARHEVVRSLDEGMAVLDHWGLPLVLKADGLARGRGVTIALNRTEAEEALHRCLVSRAFGDRGATLVLEQFLEGEEVSLIGLSDGHTVVPLAPAEDHKALLDGDRGPNTGGMGCFSPVAAFPPDAVQAATRDILQRAVDAMREEGAEFRGALFANLMITADGPKVLEFNARFGDPETEVILMRLKTDLLPILRACATGRLEQTAFEWRDEAAVCVVLASTGYPGAFEAGKHIQGLDTLTSSRSGDGPDVQVFHAGTALEDGRLITAGGRVLAVTALGAGLQNAIRRAYAAADSIHFEGVYRRGDIGSRTGCVSGSSG